MRKLEKMDWWAELVSAKDEFSLRELAERFGATPGAIKKALERNGLERKAAPPGPRSRRGRPPPPKAKVTGRRRGAPKGPRRGTIDKLMPYAGRIGKESDQSIANEAGVSIQTVARFRRSRGVSPSRSRKTATPKQAPAAAPRRRGRPSNLEAFAHLLGVREDHELAELAGIKVASVRHYRMRHGIPGPRRRSARSNPKVKPVGQRKVRPTKGRGTENATRYAYRVHVDEREVIVVGADIVEVATRAGGGGRAVHLIELLGEVLG